MTLQLRHGNQAAHADLFVLREGRPVHLLTILDADEGMELFHLLDEHLGVCCVCEKPTWLSTAGWCADGDRPYCSNCTHPKCNRLECDRGAA